MHGQLSLRKERRIIIRIVPKVEKTIKDSKFRSNSESFNKDSTEIEIK